MTTEPLSDVQLGFMQALWDLGEASVADVQAQLERAGRKLAPTTVATVLRRLEAKGWVAHREGGRGFLYRAAVSRQHVTGRLVDRLTGAFFDGNVPALVSHLLDARGVTPSDLEQIKRLIAAKELAQAQGAAQNKAPDPDRDPDGTPPPAPAPKRRSR